MRKVSAIVVTYNRLKFLKKNIKCLLNQDYKLNSIFVINNDSTDGTKSYLESLKTIPLIHVINMNKNLGGAGGFSKGLQIAYRISDSDYFWIMDDDVMPTKSSLLFLVKSANKLCDKFGFLCSDVRWKSTNIPAIANIPKVCNDWTLLIDAGLIKIKSATFVSFFVKRSTLRELGFPISQMFIWGDDTEYSTRISRKHNSYMVINSKVLHYSNSNGGNASILNSPLKRAAFYKFMYRNLLYISRKYYGSRKVIKNILHDIFVIFRILHKAKNHRIKRAFYVFYGLVKGITFNPKIKYPREVNK